MKINKMSGQDIYRWAVMGLLLVSLTGVIGCSGTSRRAYKARVQARREASLKAHRMRLLAAERGYMPASLIDPRAVGCPTCETIGKLPASGRECPTCQGQRVVVANYGVVYTFSIDSQIRLAALRRQIGRHDLAKRDLREVVRILDKKGTVKQYEKILVMFEDVLGDDRLLSYRHRYAKQMLAKLPMLDRFGNVARWHKLDRRVIKGDYGFERLLEMMIEKGKEKQAAELVWLLMKNKGYDQSMYLTMDDKRVVELLQLDERWLAWNNETYRGLSAGKYVQVIRDVDQYGHWLNAKGEMDGDVLKYVAGEVRLGGIYDSDDPVKGRLISIKMLGDWGLWDQEMRAKLQEEVLRGEIKQAYESEEKDLKGETALIE
ncbi:hypothetical protein [Poriferisphaera corsica]|nr:hypothetical protein [Poriferisphaera corsica]